MVLSKSQPYTVGDVVSQADTDFVRWVRDEWSQEDIRSAIAEAKGVDNELYKLLIRALR